ncbi:MAG: hypothetical protein ACFFAS_15695 [Promethearchaeota archaeon]
MAFLDRNYELVKNQFVKTIDNRISFGNELIDEELSSGLLNAIAKPFVQAFYNSWSKESRKECLEQVEIVLKCAKELINNELVLDDLVKNTSWFDNYLKGDQFAKMSIKKHDNYPLLVAILNRAFLSQIKSSTILLQIQDDIKDYNGLIKAAFRTKEEALNTLGEQLNLYDECLELLKKDLSMLKFPSGKKRIVKVMQLGAQESRKEFLNELESIYP